MVGVSACVLTSEFDSTRKPRASLETNITPQVEKRGGARLCALSLWHVQRGSHYIQAVSCCVDEFELTCSCHINLW
jgi:hypothetical protein